MDWLLIHFGASCGGGNFLFFPTWYHYLNSIPDANGLCTPQISSINDIWLIVAAIIEIMLRIATFVAIGFIIFAGFKYITGQAEPANVEQARKTIIYALVGLTIAVLATATINFLAGSIT